MYNIKINASPFTKEFIKTLRELNDFKINGYLNVLEVLNKEKGGENRSRKEGLKIVECNVTFCFLYPLVLKVEE